MAIKVYKLNGMGNKVSICLPTKKGRKTAQFTRQFEDMIYSTADPDVQEALENSTRYLDGRMSIAEVIESKKDGKKDNPAAPNAQKPEKIKDEPIVFEEVVNLQQAKEVLRNEYGLPANTPANKILEKAAEYGVSFPNLEI